MPVLLTEKVVTCQVIFWSNDDTIKKGMYELIKVLCIQNSGASYKIKYLLLLSHSKHAV